MFNSLLGEISGRYFIQQAFRGDSIVKSREMIKDIKEAFRTNLPNVDFLDDQTRKAAEGKLDQVFDLIGAPDNWFNNGCCTLANDCRLFKEIWIDNSRIFEL